MNAGIGGELARDPSRLRSRSGACALIGRLVAAYKSPLVPVVGAVREDGSAAQVQVLDGIGFDDASIYSFWTAASRGIGLVDTPITCRAYYGCVVAASRAEIDAEPRWQGRVTSRREFGWLSLDEAVGGLGELGVTTIDDRVPAGLGGGL